VALKHHPGMLLLNLSTFERDDLPGLRRLLGQESISAVVVIAWQRMSDDEFAHTLSNLKLIVDQYGISLSDLQGALPKRVDSAQDLFDAFSTITLPSVQ
jgi:hypothetical protein